MKILRGRSKIMWGKREEWISLKMTRKGEEEEVGGEEKEMDSIKMAGSVFGELAIMYNAARTATITV